MKALVMGMRSGERRDGGRYAVVFVATPIQDGFGAGYEVERVWIPPELVSRFTSLPGWYELVYEPSGFYRGRPRMELADAKLLDKKVVQVA